MEREKLKKQIQKTLFVYCLMSQLLLMLVSLMLIMTRFLKV